MGDSQDESVRIDIKLLRDFTSAVVKEKRLAQQLYSKVEEVSRISDDGTRLQYRNLLSRVEILVQFFQKLEETLQDVEENTIAIHCAILARLQEGTDEVKHVLPTTYL